jgi:Tol biopolymer transport system component
MNLTPGDEGLRLCVVDAETGSVEVLTDDPPGSGHPSISPDGRRLLTDETGESGGVRTAAVRLVDLAAGGWRDLCSATSPAVGGSPLRRDAHPVWDPTGRRIAFLAAPTGKRQLFVIDPDLPAGESFL